MSLSGSHFHVDFTSLHLHTGKPVQHTVGLTVGHLKERKALHQVDTPDFHLALHMVVHQLHHLFGIETVHLTQRNNRVYPSSGLRPPRLPFLSPFSPRPVGSLISGALA